MAHELSITTDGIVEAAFIVNGKEYAAPWHRLGKYVPQHMTPDEALTAAHLDWEVAMTANLSYTVKANTADTTDFVSVIPDKRVVYRKDTNAYLGVVGSRYMPIQNREQVDFIKAIVGEGGTVECVGALFGGKSTFWSIKVPGKNVLVGRKEDAINKYLIISNGHDGNTPFMAYWSPIRVVCNNTLTASKRKLGATNRISIKHTGSVMSKTDEARKILGLAGEYYDVMQETWSKMAEKQVDDGMIAMFLDEVAPIRTNNDKDTEPRLRNTLISNFTSGIGSDIAGKTVWGLYNAVTQHTSHNITGGKKSLDEKLATKFDSIYFGPKHNLDNKAFNAALALLAA